MKLLSYILIIIGVISCKQPPNVGGNDVAPNLNKEDKLINKKFNNGKTLPSTHEVSEYLNNKLSGPTGDDCQETEDQSVKPLVTKVPPVVSSKKLCDYPELGASWVKNCENLYNSGIPHDALEYTLKAFRNNFSRFRNKNCYIYSRNRGEREESFFKDNMKNGIPNKCQMVINNTKEKAPKGYEKTFRRKMYFIDICKGKVITSYFNVGTGSFKKNYKNKSGQKTTVKGVFLTGTNVFNFPGGKSTKIKYNKLRKRQAKKGRETKAHSIQLFGLQKTNNGSGPDSKYMHVSPLYSSSGCPSIDEDNYWMIKQLGNNGPSLVVTYGDGMQDIEEVNDCGPRKK